MPPEREEDTSGPRQGGGLPEAYQEALVETVVDLDILTELVRRNLQEEDIQRVLQKLSGDDRDAFFAKLSGLMRKVAALLLIYRRLSDSLFVEVLLPRLVELISDFLDAERCSVFLYDPRTRELYTRAAVGIAGEIRFPAGLGIAGQVFESGEPLLISDAYGDPRFNLDIDGRTGFRTRELLCAPLKHLRDGAPQIVGVIQALNKRRKRFDQEDLKLLEALSAPAAAALANALLHEEVRKARAEESRLLEMSSAISKEIELRPLLSRIVGTAVMVLEVERVTLYVQDRRTHELWALAGQSEGPGPAACSSHPEIAAQVFATGEAIAIADTGTDPRFDSELDRASRARTRNLLCLPVRGRRGEIVAVAEALNKKTDAFTGDDARRLEAFCGQIAIVMENARLFDELNANLGHLRSLLDASKALAGALDLDSQLQVIQDLAREVVGAESSRIFLHEAGGAIAAGVGLAGHVARTGQMLNVRDAPADPRFDPQLDRAGELPTRSVLAAPLLTHGRKLIGVLQVLNKRDDGGFTPQDEALLDALASHAAVALERARLIESAQEKQRIEASLRLAHDIQMGMLPSVFPERREFELAARLRPAKAVGGDLYDFLDDADRLWFAVGDVAGKGVPAALFMAMTRTLLHASLGRSLSPAEVLARVNRELGRDEQRALYVTAFVGCLELATGALSYSSAGHNAPYWLGRAGVRPLTSGLGLPLAILPDPSYETAQVRLEPGDALFLYTDGVSEALNREGEEFSLPRLEAFLEGARAAPAAELVEGSLSTLRSFVGDAPQSDDITVMAVRYRQA
jgi:serine phosphatase RsbU (regulator of sigma subunit)